ncbi:MAG: hypothetical protein KAQ83_04905, partial [Nanoarchaeota archaeon]|nr:hypothetical protein [Nanoarchaeota archaeon]
EIDSILCKSFHSYQKYGSFNPERKNTFSHRFETIKKRLFRMGYVVEDSGVEGSPIKLTNKGEFCSRIYSSEILTGEIFATEFKDNLSKYEIFLVLACICYEARERTKFFKKFVGKEVFSLRKKISNDAYLKRQKKFDSLNEVTAMIGPCFKGEDIFAVIENTSLLEGDVIRFFRQILDRINQILKATDDNDLMDKLESIKSMILGFMKDIDAL